MPRACLLGAGPAWGRTSVRAFHPTERALSSLDAERGSSETDTERSGALQSGAWSGRGGGGPAGLPGLYFEPYRLWREERVVCEIQKERDNRSWTTFESSGRHRGPSGHVLCKSDHLCRWSGQRVGICIVHSQVAEQLPPLASCVSRPCKARTLDTVDLQKGSPHERRHLPVLPRNAEREPINT